MNDTWREIAAMADTRAVIAAARVAGMASGKSDLHGALIALTPHLREHPDVVGVEAVLSQSFLARHAPYTCELTIRLRTGAAIPVRGLDLGVLWDRLAAQHPDWHKYRLGWTDAHTIVLGWRG